jgi:synaptic vesicle membrane protein VAT-1
MKQMFIVGHGGPEKLQLRESPDPSPAGGEIRIRVKASGINFADILARQGLYPDSPKIPCVVGYEVSGTVDTVGPGVDQTWVGSDVFALTRFGGYSDVVVVPEKQVFAKPASLSHEQAAAIPVNYLTAWQLLVVMGSLKREETVLVHNAGGGVGLAAVDIARHNLRNCKQRQARLPAPARPARGHRLPHEGLGGRTLPTHQWKRRGAHHRSARRQSLEKEL